MFGRPEFSAQSAVKCIIPVANAAAKTARVANLCSQSCFNSDTVNVLLTDSAVGGADAPSRRRPERHRGSSDSPIVEQVRPPVKSASG
jgi:hypothetical protein